MPWVFGAGRGRGSIGARVRFLVVVRSTWHREPSWSELTWALTPADDAAAVSVNIVLVLELPTASQDAPPPDGTTAPFKPEAAKSRECDTGGTSAGSVDSAAVTVTVVVTSATPDGATAPFRLEAAKFGVCDTGGTSDAAAVTVTVVVTGATVSDD